MASPGARRVPLTRESMEARINLVKVFTATKAKDREAIGEQVTSWLAARADVEVLKSIVAQSSDAEFHCLSIVLFCAQP